MKWLHRAKGAPTPRFALYSDVGPVRSQNEDACGAYAPQDGQPEEYLFVVADGMGGHAHGREASTLALEVVRTGFRDREGSVERRLRNAVTDANQRVWTRAHANGRTETMGTTCTVLAFSAGQGYLAHVGDSRLYRLEGRDLEQLSTDHTLVEELQRSGSLTKEQAKTHPKRNVLLRALGIAPTIEVDVARTGPMQRGDRYLLCSDGLGPIDEDEIADILARLDPEAAARTLVARAAEAGSTDNATAIVITL